MRDFGLGMKLVNAFTRSKAATNVATKTAAETVSKTVAKTTNTLAMQRQQAQRFVSEISEESWQKMSHGIFQQKGSGASRLVDDLGAIRKYCADNGVAMPEEVAQALNQLEHKASVFAERLNRSVSRGIEPLKWYDYGQKFEKMNKEQLTVIKDFINKERNNLFSKEWDFIRAGNDVPETLTRSKDLIYGLDSRLNFIISDNLFNKKIGQVADDVLQSGQKFYHGTKHARSIKRQGFSLLPKKMQSEMGSRELGEGIYLTPDRNVAARFAGLRGNIMHADVKLGKVAAVNELQIRQLLQEVVSELGAYSVQDAHKLELVIKELFKRNGYNAAYTKQAFSVGIQNSGVGKANDILCGGRQSQLVAFDTADVSVLNKTIRERLQNELLQLKTFVKLPYRYFKAQREVLF